MTEKVERKSKKITMSQLSRNHKVSRQALYELFKRQGWDKGNITPAIAKKVEKYYKNKNAEKKKSTKTISETNRKASKRKPLNYSISIEEKSTIKRRLYNKIQEYNFNRDLITGLQIEIEEYRKEKKGTTAKNHTGSQAAIPQIAQLEKYQSLNLKIDKHIQELEDILGYEDESEDDPTE